MNQKMKRIASLSLLTAGAAMQAGVHGQSVTAYGIVDTGVEVLTHGNAASNMLVRMPNITGSVPSRFWLSGRGRSGRRRPGRLCPGERFCA